MLARRLRFQCSWWGGSEFILLDEATIFNSSCFGFFSVFNPDAIKDLSCTKGEFQLATAEELLLFGYQKTEIAKFHVNGGIGLISSRIFGRRTIGKDKGSFLIGGSSYAHLFLKLSEEQKNNSAYFYDLNTKLSYKLDSNNSLYLSGYFLSDVFSLNKSYQYLWKCDFKPCVGITCFLKSYFRFIAHLQRLLLRFRFGFCGLNGSGIRNYNIKYDFKNYISDKFKLNYGMNGIYYEFNREPSNHLMRTPE
jgi:hypothetical protein